MIGRREFGVTGLSAIALAALEGTAFAQEKALGKPPRAGHHEMLEACANACSDCQRACDMCATHCASLLQEGQKDHAKTLATCQDCATFCVAAAQIVSRGGPFAELVCESCAEACARCGKECERFPNDEHMKMCAEECRKCEKACRDMVKHVSIAG
jgi:hypothetical protein